MHDFFFGLNLTNSMLPLSTWFECESASDGYESQNTSRACQARKGCNVDKIIQVLGGGHEAAKYYRMLME